MSVAMSVLVLVFRVWAAGFIGSTARAGQTHANVPAATGPYAHLRNPMYLTALLPCYHVEVVRPPGFGLQICFSPNLCGNLHLQENELRDTILSEQHDLLPRWEALVKLEVYSRMLDAKFKLMTNE